MSTYEASLKARYQAVSERLRPVVRVVKPVPLPPPPVLLESPKKPRSFVEVVPRLPPKNLPTGWHGLAERVAAKHGISAKLILSASRLRCVIPARHELAFRLVVERGRSLPEAGRMLKRDHTTILYAMRRHVERYPEAMIEYDAWKANRNAVKQSVREEVVSLADDGTSLTQIVKRCAVSPKSVRRIMRETASARVDRINAWAAGA